MKQNRIHKYKEKVYKSLKYRTVPIFEGETKIDDIVPKLEKKENRGKYAKNERKIQTI